MKPEGARGRDIQSRPREPAVEWAAPAQERQLRLERHPVTCAKGETEGERMRERRHGTEEEKEAVTWLGTGARDEPLVPTERKRRRWAGH
jgi:hypothetical protein